MEIVAKNGVVPVATSNLKLFLRPYGVRFKIISLYIFIKTRILGLMSHVTIIKRMAT